MTNRLIRNLLIWLFSLEIWIKRLILAGFDSLVIPLSVILAFAARLNSGSFLYEIDTYITCALAWLVTIGLFTSRGFYRAFTRHVTTNTAITIILVCLASSLALFALASFGLIKIPRSVPFIQGAFAITFISSFRFFIRALGENINRGERKNISIYGAGTAGRQLLEALKFNTKYRVCQLIDDSKKLQGQIVSGIKIENFDQAKKNLRSLNIDTILLVKEAFESDTNKRFLDLLSHVPVKLKAIPNLGDLIEGKTDIPQLRDLDIEVLLGRGVVKPEKTLMSRTITGKTVLVTGAGGSIGSELCRQILLQKPSHLLLLDISEFSIYNIFEELRGEGDNRSVQITPIIGSVQDKALVQKIIKKFPIDTIYHAAAYKHVPLMEQNIMQCISNNVFGTKNVAEVAVGKGVNNFILVSTDKAVNPTNYMGASKRLAELVCQYLSSQNTRTRFSIVRFGNVLGSSGSVVPLFKKQIGVGGPVTVTHKDVTRYFMTVREAAQLVIQAGSLNRDGGVYVLDMGEPVKIFDLAEKMILLSGKKPVAHAKRPMNIDEVPIELIGLRPGEKMFEELSFEKNLMGTSHPRIMAADEGHKSFKDFPALLNAAKKAIEVNNYTNLIKVVMLVCGDVAGNKTSTDIFHSTTTKEPSKVVSIPKRQHLQ
jgi:FlaA1/EpsC-like NDP-sugar epimerase